MMKRFILLPFLLFAFSSFSQVTFQGYLVDGEDKKMKDVSINLYDGNNIVSTENWNKKFSYDLDLEKNYTLEAKKEGFVSKKIAISTFEGNKGVEPFVFVMELEKEEGNIDEDQDFPTALIEYKKNQGRFRFDARYAKNRKKLAKESADARNK